MTDLDPFEVKILRELQRDASQTTAQIAERVGLSVSPCWRRIDRLEREGYVRKRVAILDRRKVGLSAHVFRSEEHTSELQSLMRTSYAVFCLKKKTKKNN